jgi:hypothetical protein
MAAHEAPAAVHDHIAADHARRTARELVAEMNAAAGITAEPTRPPMTRAEQDKWMGRAYATLEELARG